MRRKRREEGKEKERKEGGGRVREASVWRWGSVHLCRKLE